MGVFRSVQITMYAPWAAWNVQTSDLALEKCKQKGFDVGRVVCVAYVQYSSALKVFRDAKKGLCVLRCVLGGAQNIPARKLVQEKGNCEGLNMEVSALAASKRSDSPWEKT